ncbi:class I SAM-dependent methyltransferase [Wenzhouxiangella marina]|uniref:Methyltransferase type 11 n=1 Tax=Wenzhouxiangella marina TaxID=1579979 RepID=A0A0K0XX12_9GAMM|nr:class I SAM-dependent methyltransferase [Wenzhouxiangella marina]AKS42213.1 methyltransferase type 11 [Wenzhouxiangella marina]MBB6086015.1 ubiquinone/menaquinone biosynthesis C-methylase UbiE [Wenzhouxiangella marina]
MDELELLVDLHRSGQRQGPGGSKETRRALEMTGLAQARGLRVADIGCGTGSASLLLAEWLDAEIVAVDLFPEFLAELNDRARTRGFSERIRTLEASMDALPFAADEFDLIWSEGAIYNMGFEAGHQAWRRFLKPGGMLVVSEITWLTAERPPALQAHWEREYPEIDTASAKVAQLERHGYRPEAYFVLPPDGWLTNYYEPLEASFEAFLERNAHSESARNIVEAERREIALYRRYRDFYSYGFYIASRID